MAPVNQGMYEFKKDSLTEIRKRMGVSQNKMAELLGVPANTLSRWETGATVPDAGALAAIYSLAREQGVDTPLFFGMRSTPLELKISSKQSDQSADPLSFIQSFQRYLNTQIELIGTELAPTVSIEIRNTAPSTPDWPKIVFTEVGLSLAHTGGDEQALRPSRLKVRISRKAEEDPSDVAATPWQHDSKRERFLKIAYASIDHMQPSHYERQLGGELFPGQSIVYEMEVTSALLPYLQFKVGGTVSRRHLLHYEERFAMPENITKPLALSAFHDLYTLDLYGPLESVIKSIPKFDTNTRLEEIQTFSKALSDSMTRIEAAQEELNKIFRQHKLSWFRAHTRAAFIYLDRVNAILARTKEAIGANSPDKIASEISALLALRGESAQLGRETKELMRTYNISEEEMRGTQD